MIETDVGYAVALLGGIYLLAMALFTKGDAFVPRRLLAITLFYMFFLDFWMRGYDDLNILQIGLPQAVGYQILVHAIVVSAASLLWFLPTVDRAELKLKRGGRVVNIDFLYVPFVAFAAGAAIYKISLAHFDLPEIVAGVLAPRNVAPWESFKLTKTGSYQVATLIDAVMPVVTAMLGYWALLRGKVAAGVLFIISALFLFVGGSRTDLVIAFSVPIVMCFEERRWVRAAVITVSAITLITLAISYRSEGIENLLERNLVHVTYQQDDNVYQVIRVTSLWWKSGPTMDGQKFWAVVAVNPIPRVWWPEKPVMDQSDYGSTKLWWFTITSIGELTAMYGSPIALVVFALQIWLTGIFATRLYKEAYDLPGMVLYLSGMIYLYMCIRSLMNITQQSYFFILTIAAVYVTRTWLQSHKGSLVKLADRPSFSGGLDR